MGNQQQRHFPFAHSRLSSCNIWAATVTSKLVVGSSATISGVEEEGNDRYRCRIPH